MVNDAAKQLTEDCGSDSVLRVVVAILLECGYVCIDECIWWYVYGDITERVYNQMWYMYDNAGNLIDSSSITY